MTPLANRIVKELTFPLKKRKFADNCDLLALMGDVHCFDVTEVVPLACDLMDSGLDFKSEKLGLAAEATSFLPAPRTWIEYVKPSGRSREAYHIVDISSMEYNADLPNWNHKAVLRIACSNDSGVFGTIPGYAIFPLGRSVGADDRVIVSNDAPGDQAKVFVGAVACVHALLALINTPKIIGRRQHMPNGSLERRLLKERRTIGHFPLHAWTEIKLKVHAPANLSDDEPVEAHLTGHRALHFCRAHLRIKNGRVEFVKAHWRGDASLGIKQSRYTVTQ